MTADTVRLAPSSDRGSGGTEGDGTGRSQGQPGPLRRFRPESPAGDREVSRWTTGRAPNRELRRLAARPEGGPLRGGSKGSRGDAPARSPRGSGGDATGAGRLQATGPLLGALGPEGPEGVGGSGHLRAEGSSGPSRSRFNPVARSPPLRAVAPTTSEGIAWFGQEDEERCAVTLSTLHPRPSSLWSWGCRRSLPQRPRSPRRSSRSCSPGPNGGPPSSARFPPGP